MKRGLTYKEAGVDISEGERLVRSIKGYARDTHREGVITGVGGFGALFDASFKRCSHPVLVSATDGVGTKLKVAFMADRHDTIGIDLVAMSVNDIVTSGAEPLFFLDYFATGKLDKRKAGRVIRGVAKGCKEAGCSLIGGETAEMPGIYRSGEYDLAGFAVGVVDKARIIDGSSIKAGDILVGIASNGLHSNGYSLARRVFFERMGLNIDSPVKGLRGRIGNELLKPTRIYVRPVLSLLNDYEIKGIVHVTGGGFAENIPRVIPGRCKAVIQSGAWPVLPVFKIIRDEGPITDDEMFRTFNCGIGMILIVSRADSAPIIKRLVELNEKPYLIGEVAVRGKGERAVEIL